MQAGRKKNGGHRGESAARSLGGEEVEGGFVTERDARWDDNPPRPFCYKNIRWGDEEMLRKEAGR